MKLTSSNKKLDILTFLAITLVPLQCQEGYGVESASEDILRGFPSQASEIMGHRKFPPPVPKRLVVDRGGVRINLCR